MGREEATLPPTFPVAAAVSAWSVKPAATSARSGRRARGRLGPYMPRGESIVGRAAVRAGPPRSFHSLSAERIHSLLLRLFFFFLSFFNRWVRGNGVGKAPLSGLEKKERSRTLREKGEKGGREEETERERESHRFWRELLEDTRFPTHPRRKGSQKSEFTQRIRTAHPVGGMLWYVLQTLRRRPAMIKQGSVLLEI